MSPPHDDRFSRLTCLSGISHPDEFSPDERNLLLRLAHDAIAASLDQRELSLDPPSAHLAEPRGAFTTLYYRGGLRGCVGYVFPVTPLYRTIAETARGAAFDDSRFSPVTHDENPELTSLPQRPLPAPTHSGGPGGNRTPRPAHQSWSPPRPAAAASASRTPMEPHSVSRTNLQESGLAIKRMANRRQAGSLHRRSFRRRKVNV